ncbi:PAS domain S-box-containing protein/diguanylate cyclase (GGDEF)-like protein [Anoxybacillus vitaminiphilus]|uniref:PAS domain S-box-containing protein/diguanylate cyclase (GGDEF)-like protein n=1 Tax=Paranoxybacillus vitaminiphilus TaxID=581036 RepID=A0A327YPU5_9BACL|nr:EAL domain-containing protein [Anoxybacillus vitaminiphilus]RAK23144.1 PAS domain S-box-containing protein/diguanylate cyclase (GGDEF)-like protein [Anoxybacillus vitaminiphilus]
MRWTGFTSEFTIDEHLLFMIMNKLFDIVFLMKVEDGPRFRYVRVSNSALHLANLVEEDMGKCIEDIYSPEIAAHLNEQYRKVLETKSVVVSRDRMNTADSFRIAESTLVPIADENGNVSYILCFTRDVTEIVQQEERLQEINQLFYSFMEHSHDAFVLFDLNGRILCVNREWERLLGWKEEELVGKEIPFLPAEYRSKFKNSIKKIANGESVTSIRMPQICKDGSIIYVSANITPIFDKNGNAVAGLSLLRDLTDFMKVHEQLRRSEELYRKVIDFFPEMVVIHMNGTILYMNPAGIDMIRAANQNVVQGRHLNEFIKKVDGADDEWLLKTLEGEFKEVQVKGTKIQYNDEQAEILVIRDLTEQKTKDQKIKFMAQYDALTGLPNRTFLKEKLNEQLFSHNGKQLAILLIDIDRFKFINDLLGHSNGDLVLREVAERLRTLDSEDVFLSRIGSDEFVVAYTYVNEEELKNLLNCVSDVLNEPYFIAGEKLNITTSIAISRSSDANLSVETLLSNADKAVYYAKMNGTNLAVEYNSQIHDIFAKKLRLETDLQTALEKNEFSLFYQPKINFRSNSISLEALLRWEHSQLGMVSPAEFIPIAEETNLIVDIGKWVLEQACRDVKKLEQMGFSNIKMAVNLSAKQFNEGNLEKVVSEIFKKFNADASCFELEITETTIMKDPTETIEILQKLKQKNITIAIDDFGVSYSSLNYLNRFPIDAVKIDRSFIRDLSENRKGTEIVEMMILLAHKLNLRVTAEGVETEEQVRYLLEKGCDEMQGYYFSKPVPFNELSNVLTRLFNMINK